LREDVLFGAQVIADELGLELRRTFYLLERGSGLCRIVPHFLFYV
jgi:hypothetical protein